MTHSIATKGDNQHNKILHVIMVSIAIKSTMLSGVTGKCCHTELWRPIHNYCLM